MNRRTFLASLFLIPAAIKAAIMGTPDAPAWGMNIAVRSDKPTIRRSLATKLIYGPETPAPDAAPWLKTDTAGEPIGWHLHDGGKWSSIEARDKVLEPYWKMLRASTPLDKGYWTFHRGFFPTK